MPWIDLIAFGKVVSTELKGAAKAILANLSFLESEDGQPNTSSSEPMFGAGPLFWRPKPPVKASEASGLNPEGAAEVVAFRVGDETIIGPMRDLRLNAQANPKDGEVVLAQYGGGFISLKDNDDGDGTSIVIYGLRKTSQGVPDKASCIAIDTTSSNKSIVLVHENGQSITMNKDGGTVLASPDGQAYIELKNGSIVLNAANIVLNGGCLLGTNNPAVALFLEKAVDTPCTMVKGV